MANEEMEQPQQEQVKKKSSSLKYIIIGLVIMIVIPLIGFFVVSKFVLKDDQAEDAKEQSRKVGEIFPLEVIVVNIANTGGTRYLRAGISFEVTESGVIAELTQRIPQIKDLIIMILSVKELEDLIDFSGKNQIRKEIFEKINAILQNGKIKNVYFTEFVIQ